ncbi:unnamed protein product [Lactuca saligna]|uniref:Uncharacterized protein n=1 Tax=Lactuca saligna TaxID=75948 RepID=A0AA35VUX0_LACSI|nr:unnamed protein product [Lactuca saligna]
MMLPQSGVKSTDKDNGNGGGMGTRVFSPSGVPGIQWRPGGSFQSQHEGEDFDDFEDVDMLYNTLSLDKVEALEDLVIIGPPDLVKVTTYMLFKLQNPT